MLDAPRHLHPGRDGRSCSEALLLIDTAAGVLLDASAEGWRLWGGDATAVPVRLDRAMPALQRLADGAETGLVEDLVFWTGSGTLRLDCHVDRAGPHQVLLRAKIQGGADPGRARTDVTAQARLAHELRTPLNAAAAYAEILKDERFGPIGNARYRDYARNIHDSVRHTLGVIESMLGTDPARGGVRDLVFADIDVAPLVESCVTVARPLAEEADLRLAVELAPRLPRVIADEVSLRQMLLNLLTNAIKFGRPGDRIVVRASHEPGGMLRIDVTDTGPGIEPGAAQAARPRRGAGLGIGLPLTRALAEANGARLLIDSAPGRGTEVTIAFDKNRIVPV